MIVTLTDFGASYYLGVMKGVIQTMCPTAKTVDLCNTVTAHSITEGAWVLLQGYSYFPKDTVFLCVVDPGVGSERSAIFIQSKKYYFVGPDNGLMYPAASKDGIEQIYQISEKPVSRTFHGRDVFARVAAQLEADVPFSKLGNRSKKLRPFHFHLSGREGQVVHIDQFGNIVTNLKQLNKKVYVVAGMQLPFYRTYEEADEGKLFLIRGSANTLELSLKNGSANNRLHYKVGQRITVS